MRMRKDKPVTPMKLSFIALVVVATSFPLLDVFGKGQEPTRLIKLGPENFEFVSENTKLMYKRNKVNFIDITNKIDIDEARNLGLVSVGQDSSLLKSFALLGSKQLSEVITPKVYDYPKKAVHQDKVNEYITQIDSELMYDNLAEFSSFYTRYYKSNTGVESAEWLEKRLLDLAADTDVTVSRVKHDGWDQFSLIASIPGTVDTKVVVGAHQDSANLILPNSLPAPGADDDGSGTITILEAFRILIQDYKAGNFKPHQTLEFHFYSAEEGGLLGSYDVFDRYYYANVTVIGLLQQDMTGYTGNMDPNDIHMGLIEDYTSPSLNEFIKMIVETYCAIPYHSTECGYACSDHASALEHGYPASFVIESEFRYSSKYIHSVMDTIDRIDFDHVKEHTKLTIGFAYEMSMAKVKEV
ncbi:Zn-dependent exopeptidase [Yamadazyma tenuis ATCC 10573]|uniref:Peptide hydrolase n=2 Tax=Candida tenuis (strain ATCC 10573 / BCRC 21748 / CBS 615 / JCM 9827 / NBRC 10315 / NRRL Y-1498 / VKM Y-70) TaxID=590646 RepID=G3B6K6_CANTC|nr:Zn-dependent exopeptidase [Yamadazyma tenuis ATCC 10573]EGV63697.1 Zn-dependent exopeptidase [Yamadazyma tenuis ATCC 10573]